MTYRGYLIWHEPKPVPTRVAGPWSFVHEDYDGAPDANGDGRPDPRYGDATSPEDARAQIDDLLTDADPKMSAETMREALRRLSAQAKLEAEYESGDMHERASRAHDWLESILWNVEGGEPPAGLCDLHGHTA